MPCGFRPQSVDRSRDFGVLAAGDEARGGRPVIRCRRPESVQCSRSRWNTQRRHALIVTSRPRALIEPMTATSVSRRPQRKQAPHAHSNRPHNSYGFIGCLRRLRGWILDRRSAAVVPTPWTSRRSALPAVHVSAPPRPRPLLPSLLRSGCRPVPDGGEHGRGCRPGPRRDVPRPGRRLMGWSRGARSRQDRTGIRPIR